MATSVHRDTGAASLAHSTFREGVVVGMLGALAVAVWFLIVDTVAGRPLHTPAVLGAIVSHAADPIAAADGPDRLKLAALYTPIHCILFALFGVVVVFLIHHAQRRPSLLTLGVMLFAAFEVGFTGMVALLEQTALGDLAWYQVAIGNLIAVVAMGWYLMRRHPGVAEIWSHRFDDRG
jgi:hypothetical protein